MDQRGVQQLLDQQRVGVGLIEGCGFHDVFLRIFLSNRLHLKRPRLPDTLVSEQTGPEVRQIV